MTQPTGPITPIKPPGVALERTTMAWLRTVLVLTVVALLFLRVQALVPALGGMAAAWALGLVQWLRHPRRLRHLRDGDVRPEAAAAALLTGLVVLLAVAGLVAVFL